MFKAIKIMKELRKLVEQYRVATKDFDKMLLRIDFNGLRNRAAALVFEGKMPFDTYETYFLKKDLDKLLEMC